MVDTVRTVPLPILAIAALGLIATTTIAQTATESESPATPIEDFAETVGSVVIDEDFAIEDIRIELDVTHSFRADLVVTLDSPDGSSIVLVSDAGGSDDDLLVTFSTLGCRFDEDELAAGLATELQPQGPGSLGDLTGISSAGVWELRIFDDASGDQGLFNQWTLILSGNPGTPPICPGGVGNDTCETATLVTSGSVVAFTTEGATTGDTPSCGGSNIVDVWYEYEAPCSGTLVATTSDADFDTRLALWPDCPSTGAQEITCDDDSGPGLLSLIEAQVIAGETYLIQVGGAGSADGEGTLEVECLPPPPNDDCTQATNLDLSSGTATVLAGNVGADSAEVLPDCIAPTAALRDTWYLFPIPNSGSLTVETAGSFDTLIALWPACPQPGDTAVACDRDSGIGFGASQFTLMVTAGETYWLQFGGDLGSTGQDTLTLTLSADAANDACDQATTVSAGTTNLTNFGSTASVATCDSGVDTWYLYEATCDGDLTFESEAEFDHSLTVWDSCPPTGTVIDCQSGVANAINTSAATGSQYWIQFASSTIGNATLEIQCLDPVLGDDCGAAVVLTDGATTFDTTSATMSGINPGASAGCPASADPVDVWFEYTASCTGTLILDTEGSSFDTRLAVWDACPAPGDPPLVCDDDSGTGLLSQLQLEVDSGQTLLVQSSGFAALTGSGVLNVECLGNPAANDNCEAAELRTVSGVDQFFVDTSTATASGVAPDCGEPEAGRDLWYEIEPDCSEGAIRFSLPNQDSLPIARLAVYASCGDAEPLACAQGAVGFDDVSVTLPAPAGSSFFLQISGVGGSTGTLVARIECVSPETVFVEQLVCPASSTDGEALISWSSPFSGLLDSIEVTVDGVLDQSLPSDSTSAVVSGLTPGSHTICVAPQLAGVTSGSTCCTVVVSEDLSGRYVIVDKDSGGLIESPQAITSALTAIGIAASDVETVDSVLEIGGSPALVWVCLGTFPFDGDLDLAEGARLNEFVTQGLAPIVVEGADYWSFGTPSDFNLVDGVADGSIEDGDDSFTSMVGEDTQLGIDTTNFGASYNQDSAGNDYTDRLVAASSDALGSSSADLFLDADQDYVTAVAYSTDGSATHVISQSWEFGGYGGDQAALLELYLDFLEIPTFPDVSFVRGDVNHDSLRDIADAILLLEQLFIGSKVLGCEDARDGNDDGLINIADAIFLLEFLFLPGSPPPAAPGPDCGEDPTSDGLDCSTYPCP